jgi:hypothetical protein
VVAIVLHVMQIISFLHLKVHSAVCLQHVSLDMELSSWYEVQQLERANAHIRHFYIIFVQSVRHLLVVL